VANLRTWTPDSNQFAILLQVIAGPAGSAGEESFDVILCTATWLSRRVEEEQILSGRHLLMVSRYSYDLVHDYITKYVTSCSGDTWQEVAAQLGRLGRWEFEDYQE
jgi:hypothetical protein